MATTYEEPNDLVLSLLDQAMTKWHGALKVAGVQVGVLMASNPDGPAVKHGGYPAAATIKIVGPRDRLKKKYDVELIIDQHAWIDMSQRQKLAMLDHELSHVGLVPAKKPDGDILWKLDYLGRPKLRSIKGDWNGGDGFQNVVERHGEDALEFRNAEMCYGIVRDIVAVDQPLKIAE